MKLVVGLGNPGKEYAGTPHNVGFDVVDRLVDRTGGVLRRSLRFRARLGATTLSGQDVLLAKPETFMNLSGAAVGGILAYRKLALADLVVVLDDADLDLGLLRVRARGGSGGHRGLASIIGAVGGDAFTRVRIGIGRGDGGRDLMEHVLGRFSAEERRRIEPVLDRAAEAVACVVGTGVDAAMNRFNGPAAQPAPADADGPGDEAKH